MVPRTSNTDSRKVAISLHLCLAVDKNDRLQLDLLTASSI